MTLKTHIFVGGYFYFKEPDRTIFTCHPMKKQNQKENLSDEESGKTNTLTLAKEERSSAIVDELKRNEDEKAFFGYPFEFLCFFVYSKAYFSALIAATCNNPGRNCRKSKRVRFVDDGCDTELFSFFFISLASSFLPFIYLFILAS